MNFCDVLESKTRGTCTSAITAILLHVASCATVDRHDFRPGSHVTNRYRSGMALYQIGFIFPTTAVALATHFGASLCLNWLFSASGKKTIMRTHVQRPLVQKSQTTSLDQYFAARRLQKFYFVGRITIDENALSAFSTKFALWINPLHSPNGLKTGLGVVTSAKIRAC